MRSTIAIAAFAFAGVTAAAVPAMAASSHHKAAYHKTSYHKASYQKHAHVSGRKAVRKVATRKSYGGGGGSHGVASYYWQGQQTASGARFNPEGLTAAHRTLPVRHARSRHEPVQRPVGRRHHQRPWPFVGGRVIDLSRGAARRST